MCMGQTNQHLFQHNQTMNSQPAFLPSPTILSGSKRGVLRKRMRHTPTCNLHKKELSRRQLLQLAVGLGSGIFVSSSTIRSATLKWTEDNKENDSYLTVYSVIPKSLSEVGLIPQDVKTAVNIASEQNVVFLGEHHNSLVDHALQARIIGSLSSKTKRNITVGLECIQQQFQPVLDAYIAGEISELDLYFDTEWETRWGWPYERYLPVFRMCKEKQIPLVALSMNFETLSKVRKEGGITNLSQTELREHVGDPRVFVNMASEEGFKTYVEEIITPSYFTHVRMGLLTETANFNSFYSSRIIRDESMATRAVRHIAQNPSTLLVCLLGADHVKFEYGVKGRVQRQLEAVKVQQKLESLAETAKELPADEIIDYTRYEPPKLMSVMLNPSPADAFNPVDGSLRLKMGMDGSPILIADYLWFSSPGDAKSQPHRQAHEWYFPNASNNLRRLTSWYL